MKETGTTYWFDPNTGATNSSGFAGLPGGFRDEPGASYSIGYYGYWWSSTEPITPYAGYFSLASYRGSNSRSYGYAKRYGFSVRCLRD